MTDDMNNLPEVQTSSAGELQVTRQSVEALAEIRGAIQLAKEFPRNENYAFMRLMQACERKKFAEKVEYKYPRGGKQIEGPSVYVAREAAKYYGNMRIGLSVIRQTDEEIQIEGWAWDIENNTRQAFQDTFKRLIQRKVKQGREVVTQWVVPDERDMRELMFRRGAILVRNAILAILPSDLIDDAVLAARNTIVKNIRDPKAEKKNMLVEIGRLGVTIEQVNRYFKTEDWTVEHLVDLRAILNSIKDGNSKISDYFRGQQAEGEEPTTKTESLKQKLKKKVDGDGTTKPAEQPEPGEGGSSGDQPDPDRADPKKAAIIRFEAFVSTTWKGEDDKMRGLILNDAVDCDVIPFLDLENPEVTVDHVNALIEFAEQKAKVSDAE